MKLIKLYEPDVFLQKIVLYKDRRYSPAVKVMGLRHFLLSTSAREIRHQIAEPRQMNSMTSKTSTRFSPPLIVS